MPELHRRRFLTASAATAASLTALTAAGAAGRPNERIQIAVMGVRGRGRDHIRMFSALDDVEIAYVCDPDDNVVPAALKAVAARQKRPPRVERDVRRVLQDKAVTALVIAAPDHWHALATIWACQAGKHVYVEKPASHNLIEGRRMVEAARKYHRVVQLGTQSRSSASLARAAEFVRSGKLGKTPHARAWIGGSRPNIGHQKDAEAPTGVDYNLWLGPAPERPFNANRFHYRWHWMWDYGTGELGNNGIHALDRLRWIMDLDAPTRIVAAGGKFFYDDDQETPDTLTATYEFPTCSVSCEHRIWSPGTGDGAAIYGEHGILMLDREGWHVQKGVDATDKGDGEERSVEGSVHQRNFIDCIKSSSGTSVRRPNADIEEGHKSTRLCHLGNIAFRTGRALRFDADTETLVGDAEANRLLGRTYRKPFVLPEKV
jgi:predicted dehydrogenase